MDFWLKSFAEDKGACTILSLLWFLLCAREGMAASAEYSASLLGTFSQQQTYKLFCNGSMLLWPFANLL